MIKNKSQFYQLSKLGLCGNTMKTWDSWDCYFPYRFQYPYIGIRRTIINCPLSFARLHWESALKEVKKMQYNSYVISEVPPLNIENKYGLQGELTWFNYAQNKAGYVFYYTHKLGYMRSKLSEDGKHIYGWNALRLIRSFCTQSEYDQLIDLFDKHTYDYKYPVIEFAIMNQPMGIYNQKLIIWEIRNGY